MENILHETCKTHGEGFWLELESNRERIKKKSGTNFKKTNRICWELVLETELD